MSCYWPSFCWILHQKLLPLYTGLVLPALLTFSHSIIPLWHSLPNYAVTTNSVSTVKHQCLRLSCVNYISITMQAMCKCICLCIIRGFSNTRVLHVGHITAWMNHQGTELTAFSNFRTFTSTSCSYCTVRERNDPSASRRWKKTLKNTHVTQQVQVLFWMQHRWKGSLKHKICIAQWLVRLVTKKKLLSLWEAPYSTTVIRVSPVNYRIQLQDHR